MAGSWNYGYGYSDYDGSPTSIRYPAAGGLPVETVTTTYDPTSGLPTTLDTNATGVSTYIANQQYTPYGEPTLTTRKTAGGLYVQDATYYEQATRRINRVAIQPETATGTVSNRNYTYDAAGNITSIADRPEAGPTDIQCFRYDTLRRLTSAWTPNPTTDCTTDPTLTTLAGPAPYWQDWTIDPVGNRRTETSHAATGDTTRSYTHPTGGPGIPRPHAVTTITTRTGTQPTITTNYSYDTSGNTTCRPTSTAANTCPTGTGSQTLTWDPEGRLATIAAAGGSTLQTNIYSPGGTRWIRRDTTAGTTLYLPNQETSRTSGGATNATRYYTFNGQTIATRTPGGLAWTYTDHQGTQHTTITTTTQTTTTRRQTPYGQPRGTNPTWTNPKGFVGGHPDPTGLTHLGARQYDPNTGRFTSVDPILDLNDAESWHGFAYAGNSPVSFSDADGLKRIAICECFGGRSPQGTGNAFIPAQRWNAPGGRVCVCPPAGPPSFMWSYQFGGARTTGGQPARVATPPAATRGGGPGGGRGGGTAAQGGGTKVQPATATPPTARPPATSESKPTGRGKPTCETCGQELKPKLRGWPKVKQWVKDSSWKVAINTGVGIITLGTAITWCPTLDGAGKRACLIALNVVGGFTSGLVTAGPGGAAIGAVTGLLVGLGAGLFPEKKESPPTQCPAGFTCRADDGRIMLPDGTIRMPRIGGR